VCGPLRNLDDVGLGDDGFARFHSVVVEKLLFGRRGVYGCCRVVLGVFDCNLTVRGASVARGVDRDDWRSGGLVQDCTDVLHSHIAHFVTHDHVELT